MRTDLFPEAQCLPDSKSTGTGTISRPETGCSLVLPHLRLPSHVLVRLLKPRLSLRKKPTTIQAPQAWRPPMTLQKVPLKDSLTPHQAKGAWLRAGQSAVAVCAVETPGRPVQSLPEGLPRARGWGSHPVCRQGDSPSSRRASPRTGDCAQG